MRGVHWTLLLSLLGLLNLPGCSSNPPEPEVATERQSLDRSARLAFDQGQYAQASSLYQSALDQALLEDDPEAIIDARFNLALSHTYLGQYRQALEQLTQADAERQRRSMTRDPELLLLESTVLYRSGESAQAQRVLNEMFTLTQAASAVAMRGHFLAGLIAADQSDDATLQTQIKLLQGASDSESRADLIELQGIAAGMHDNAIEAYSLLDQATVLRSINRDYRGMSRVLASAGRIAANKGDIGLAANYFLRAGRSAAQRNEPDAKPWLQRAAELGRQTNDQALVTEADELLTNLSGAAQP